jgi:hypothetical protein
LISLSQRLNSNKKESVIRKWEANEEFDKSDVVLTEDGIYHLVCQIAGKTGFVKPNLLGLKNNDLVNDGTVTWKVQLVQVEDKKLTYQIVNSLEEIKRPKENVLYMVKDINKIRNFGQNIFFKMVFSSREEMEMAYEQYGQIDEGRRKYSYNKYAAEIIQQYDGNTYNGVVYQMTVTDSKGDKHRRNLTYDATQYEGAWAIINPIEEAITNVFSDVRESFEYLGMTDKDIFVDKYGNITYKDGYVIYFHYQNGYGRLNDKLDITTNPIKSIKFYDITQLDSYDFYHSEKELTEMESEDVEISPSNIGFNFDFINLQDSENVPFGKIYMYIGGEFVAIKDETNTATAVAEKVKKIIFNNLLDY